MSQKGNKAAVQWEDETLTIDITNMTRSYHPLQMTHEREKKRVNYDTLNIKIHVALNHGIECHIIPVKTGIIL